jgi:hypothetical protein
MHLFCDCILCTQRVTSQERAVLTIWYSTTYTIYVYYTGGTPHLYVLQLYDKHYLYVISPC